MLSKTFLNRVDDNSNNLELYFPKNEKFADEQDTKGYGLKALDCLSQLLQHLRDSVKMQFTEQQLIETLDKLDFIKCFDELVYSENIVTFKVIFGNLSYYRMN